MLWFYFILGLIFISHCFKLTQALPYAKTRKIKLKLRIKLNHNIYDWEFHCGVIVESAKKRRSSSSAYGKNFVGGAEHNLPE